MRHLIVIPAYNEEEALSQNRRSPPTLPADLKSRSLRTDRRIAPAMSPNAAGPEQSAAGSSRPPAGQLRDRRRGTNGLPVRGRGRRISATSSSSTPTVSTTPTFSQPWSSDCEREQLDLCVGSRFFRDFGAGLAIDIQPPHRHPLLRLADRPDVRHQGHRPDERLPLSRAAGLAAVRRSLPGRLPRAGVALLVCPQRLRVGEMPVRMFERQGGVSTIRKLKAAYYMVKVSLAIIFDRIRGRKRPA